MLPFVQARDHCNLEHVVSLWRTLSLQLAKQHTIAEHVSDTIVEYLIANFVSNCYVAKFAEIFGALT